MASSARPHTVDEDSELIDEMVSSAKSNEWENVWSILSIKPYIVNCIPENRAWSAIHQAVYLDNKEAIRLLIEEYNADIHIKTKICKNGEVEAGSNVFDLATACSTDEIKKFLRKKRRDLKMFFDSKDIAYFFKQISGKVNNARECPLILMTLANYKGLFLNGESYEVSDNLHLAMKQVMDELPSTWEDVREKINHNLITIDKEFADELAECETKENFFEKLIETYTDEFRRQSLYKVVAKALQKQPDSDEIYIPEGTDLAVGPYILTLNAVIMAWDELEPYSGTTYRGVDEDISDDYEENKTFVFTSFISSSKDETVATEEFATLSGTVFEIDNSAKSKWRPRDIESISSHPQERECLYPIGAEFLVTCVSGRTVYLKLQD